MSAATCESSRRPKVTLDDVVPAELMARFSKFLLDGASGFVRFNIRDGKILGLTVEEHLNPK